MIKICHGLFETSGCLDLVLLKKSCYEVFESTKSLPLDPVWIDNPGQPHAPKSTKKILQYNLLTFTLPQIHNLFKFIQSSFYTAEKNHYGTNLNLNYYIQAWVNVYKQDEFLDWHGHHYPAGWGWHGFFCVDVEPSNTLYRFNDDIITVPSLNNKLVIGVCENNEHKTESWDKSDSDRITIAFDIIPDLGLKNARPNHWIPM